MAHTWLFLFIGAITPPMEIHVTGSEDPCDEANNKLLSDLAKRSSTFDQNFVPLCDRYIDLGWYRTSSYQMVTSPPALLKCGTLYPIWLNGTFPVNGNATLPACRVGFWDSCEHSFNIEVKHCGTFMVYKLQPLDICNSAYCFDALPDCVMETPSSAEVKFHNISWKTKEDDEKIEYNPSLNLICDFATLANETIYYNIDWYIDNDLVVDDQTVQSASKEQAVLTAYDFRANGKKIGSLVHCVVGAKRSANNTACFTISSSQFYAGVQVLTPQLSIPRKGSAILRLKLTIPYAAINVEIGGNEFPPDYLYIQLKFPDDINPSCSIEGNVNRCEIKINGYSYGNRSAYETDDWKKEYTVTIYNKDTVGYDIDTHLTLRLSTTTVQGDESKIFENAQLPDIPVSIYEDTSASVWKGKRCYAHSDPHMMTFDRTKYECQGYGCAVGKTYILYRNDKYHQQVQVKHQQCWSARCICAVAVRAGRDIFTIDKCSGTKYINFPLCEDKEMRVIKTYDRQYKIYLPTGTQVILNLWLWDILGINVDIYPTVSDVGNTDGLCGTLDGDWTNDFLNRKTNQTQAYALYPDVFSQSWSLESNEANNIFSSRFNNFPSLATSMHRFCTCNTTNGAKGNFECNYKSYVECGESRGKKFVCALYPSGSKRRRRATESFSAKSGVDVHNFDESLAHVQKRQSNPMSEYEATEICTLAFEQSDPYKNCLFNVPNFSNSSLENCIKDLSLTGQVNLTQMHIEAALSQCVFFVQLNGTLQKQQPELSNQIISLCPNNCSGHGICNEGNCTCNKGYAASDCSFDLSDNPTIEEIEGDGFCDKTKDICGDVTMTGQYFLENMGAICYMQRLEIQINGTVNRKTDYEVALQERTLYEGYCDLNYETNDIWITEFFFNISIDGKQFTNTYQVYVYQSACQIINNQSGSVYFTLQDGYCFIEGQCVTDRANKTNNICLYCDITANKYNWSVKEDCRISTSTPPTYGSARSWSTNPVDGSSSFVLQTSSRGNQMSTRNGSQTTAEGIDVSSISTTVDGQTEISITLAVIIAVLAFCNVIIIIKITTKRCQNRKMETNVPERDEPHEHIHQPLPNTFVGHQSAPLDTNYKEMSRTSSGVSRRSHFERPSSALSNYSNYGIRSLSLTIDLRGNVDNDRSAEDFYELFGAKHS